MIRAFERLDQFLNLLEVRQSQLYRLHNKWLSDRLFRGCQTQPQKAIDDTFQRLTRFANFLVQQRSYVVIEGKSGSHILMLTV